MNNIQVENDLSSMNWRERAMINHQRGVGTNPTNNLVERNPRLYGQRRQNNRQNVNSYMSNLRELRQNMENFDSMLDEIDRFQQQTESLVHNLQEIDAQMGDRELEVVDDPDPKPKGLDEADLGMQKIYNFDSNVHQLKDATCSICLIDIEDDKEAP